MSKTLRGLLSFAPLFLGLFDTLSGQEPGDDPQQRTLTGLRTFAVHARVQLSDPAALPTVDEALLRSRLEDAVRQAGM